MAAGNTTLAIIEEVLPRGLYKVRCDDGRILKVSLTPEARQARTNLIPGDQVTVEASPYDPARGRIRH
jgi:translation initiation factor IF-1